MLVVRTALAVVLFAACAPTAPSTASATTPAETTAPTTPAATTTPTETPPPSPSGEARLPSGGGRPKPLAPGTYLSPNSFAPVMTVTVPDGWYGVGGTRGFGVGQGLDEVNQRFRDVELYVDVIDMPFGDAVAAFQAIEANWDIDELTPDTIDGREAVTFHAQALGAPVLLEDALGVGIDIGVAEGQQTFVDVGSATILVRTAIYEEAAEPVLDRVLASLAFEE